MKIHIGKNTMAEGGFKITTDDGRDITSELVVSRIEFDLNAPARQNLKLHIDTFLAEVDIELLPEDITIIDKDGERILTAKERLARVEAGQQRPEKHHDIE